MTQKLVRMHIPHLGGAQNVNASDVALWESKGGRVMPDLTPEEIAEADAAAKADKETHAMAEDAQAASNALALKEVEDALKAQQEPTAPVAEVAKVPTPVAKTKPLTPAES